MWWLVACAKGPVPTMDAPGPTDDPRHAILARAHGYTESPPVGSGSLSDVDVLLKDNIDAIGFPTTAGSLALAGNRPPDDAFLVARLREAGARVAGKTNLTEWANFRGNASISGWSAVGGQTGNAYDPRRSPCGSSSGSAVAVAMGLAPMAVATETDGSILCPSSMNGVVGVKPTVGLVSRDGVVPIAHSQDTAGPMARTVTDAARLLEVISAADPNDPASARRPAGLDTKYTAALKADALKGARIGVARKLDDFSPKVDGVFERALADLARLGAVLVEVDLALPETVGADEEEVLMHEFRPDLDAYLRTVEPPTSLAALIAFNEAHAAEELRWFGQELFEQGQAHPDDPEKYAAAAQRLRDLGPGLIDATLKSAGVVAFVAPTNGPAWLIDEVNGDLAWTGGTSTITAVTGYPAVTVPMGLVEGLPVGITFFGTAFDEGRLLGLAYAYEQGSERIPPPTRSAPGQDSFSSAKGGP
jgi:amidase